MKKQIAFFDFDGTITTNDTMLELIRFHHGSFRFLTGMLLLSPYLVMMKAGLMTNQAAKEKMLAHFFGGMELEVFDKVCQQFALNRIPSMIRPGALEKIGMFKQAGTEVVIVTASAGNWIRPWSDTHGLSIIATVLETINGKLTGRLLGKNCHGVEKVVRIKATYKLDEYGNISSFGDTSGDKPMLALANEPFYKPFRK